MGIETVALGVMILQTPVASQRTPRVPVGHLGERCGGVRSAGNLAKYCEDGLVCSAPKLECRYSCPVMCLTRKYGCSHTCQGRPRVRMLHEDSESGGRLLRDDVSTTKAAAENSDEDDSIVRSLIQFIVSIEDSPVAIICGVGALVLIICTCCVCCVRKWRSNNPAAKALPTKTDGEGPLTLKQQGTKFEPSAKGTGNGIPKSDDISESLTTTSNPNTARDRGPVSLRSLGSPVERATVVIPRREWPATERKGMGKMEPPETWQKSTVSPTWQPPACLCCCVQAEPKDALGDGDVPIRYVNNDDALGPSPPVQAHALKRKKPPALQSPLGSPGGRGPV